MTSWASCTWPAIVWKFLPVLLKAARLWDSLIESLKLSDYTLLARDDFWVDLSTILLALKFGNFGWLFFDVGESASKLELFLRATSWF